MLLDFTQWAFKEKYIYIYHVPADVCLNFSLFFFLHFQGLSRRPRVANLLRRRIGGVWVLGTTDSERMVDSLSTSSAVREEKKYALIKIGSGAGESVALPVIFC